jgi:hypothetical protein
MSPSKKRTIPKVDLSPYLEEDIITIKPKDKEVRMEIGSDRCRTVVLDEKASLQLLLSHLKQSTKVWGHDFMRKFLTYAEKI